VRLVGLRQGHVLAHSMRIGVIGVENKLTHRVFYLASYYSE
jgi:hypothetical protein